MLLNQWGWDASWSRVFADAAPAGLEPARVLHISHRHLDLISAGGLRKGELSGRLEYAADSTLQLPAVGDWVAVTPTDPALAVTVLPRRSLFTRAVEGEGRQPLAANIDIALLVCGLDGDYSPRRLERYLVLCREAQVRPVILLNKRDACLDLPAALTTAIEAAGPETPVLPVSAHYDNMEAVLGRFVRPGETAALFGSSGAGKSTIVNSLLGRSQMATLPVRESDSRGRHATTGRHLFLLPQGWLLMDTPGLREVGITGAPDILLDTFPDIAALAGHCRYRDCTHDRQPGCAVTGQVSEGRLNAYRKLLREAAYQHRKEDPAAARAEKLRWKKIHRQMRNAEK